jgi:phage-related tail fiber protein
MAQYQTVITDIGSAKIAAAIASGTPCLITEAAAGDGNGAQYTPTPAQIELRNEVWRGFVISSDIDPAEPNMINVRFVIPPDEGGFTVREAGLFDGDGDLLAVCNLPDTRKEVYSSGTTGKLTIIMHIIVTDAGALAFDIHPQLDGVTQDQLTSAISAHDNSSTAHSNILAALDAVVNALPNDFYTKAQTDQLITDAVYTHDLSATAHGGIRAGMAGLDSRVTNLETMMGGGISTNPFSVTFTSLAGVNVTGVWNQTQGRIDF